MAIALQAGRQQVVWTSGINVLLGLWLVIAPFLLGYSGLTAALWNDVAVGALIAILAGIRTAKPLQQEGISWTNVVLGAWLIVAPFVLGYGAAQAQPGSATGAALSNDIIVGLLVVVLASWSGFASKAAKRNQPSAGRGPVR